MSEAYVPSETALIFAAIALCTALLGVVLLLLSAMIIRGGTPREQIAGMWAGDAQWQASAQLGVFERELITDGGSTVANVANLLIYSSVVASLGVSFPQWWIADGVAFVISLTFVALILYWSLGEMRRKRTRMQNLFETLTRENPGNPIMATGNFGVPIRSERDYWLDRCPSFAEWRAAKRMRRNIILLQQLVRSIRWYWPIERDQE